MALSEGKLPDKYDENYMKNYIAIDIIVTKLYLRIEFLKSLLQDDKIIVPKFLIYDQNAVDVLKKLLNICYLKMQHKYSKNTADIIIYLCFELYSYDQSTELSEDEDNTKKINNMIKLILATPINDDTSKQKFFKLVDNMIKNIKFLGDTYVDKIIDYIVNKTNFEQENILSQSYLFNNIYIFEYNKNLLNDVIEVYNNFICILYNNIMKAEYYFPSNKIDFKLIDIIFVPTIEKRAIKIIKSLDIRDNKDIFTEMVHRFFNIQIAIRNLNNEKQFDLKKFEQFFKNKNCYKNNKEELNKIATELETVQNAVNEKVLEENKQRTTEIIRLCKQLNIIFDYHITNKKTFFKMQILLENMIEEQSKPVKKGKKSEKSEKREYKESIPLPPKSVQLSKKELKEQQEREKRDLIEKLEQRYLPRAIQAVYDRQREYEEIEKQMEEYEAQRMWSEARELQRKQQENIDAWIDENRKKLEAIIQKQRLQQESIENGREIARLERELENGGVIARQNLQKGKEIDEKEGRSIIAEQYPKTECGVCNLSVVSNIKDFEEDKYVTKCCGQRICDDCKMKLNKCPFCREVGKFGFNSKNIFCVIS
jgi:hypothetical protein